MFNMLKKIYSFFVSLIATGLFSGKIKYISGTAGSFVAIILYYFIAQLPIFIQFGILILTTIIGTLSIYTYLSITKQQGKDPKEVVIDEIVAVFLICFIAKLITPELKPQNYLVVFALFRFFDILKPYPISVIDKKMKNPIGIMLDDILAGFLSVCIYIIIFA